MAGSPTQLVLALLDEFARDTRKSHTINQLALSTKKAYPNVHAAATALLAEEILKKETIGHSHRCRLNLDNDRTLLYLSLLQSQKRDDFLREHPGHRNILREIDAISAQSGVLLAWHQNDTLLLVTTTGTPAPELTIPAKTLPLKQFLDDKELVATIGEHTLLFGHALYASLLRHGASKMEVFR